MRSLEQGEHISFLISRRTSCARCEQPAEPRASGAGESLTRGVTPQPPACPTSEHHRASLAQPWPPPSLPARPSSLGAAQTSTADARSGSMLLSLLSSREHADGQQTFAAEKRLIHKFRWLRLYFSPEWERN